MTPPRSSVRPPDNRLARLVVAFAAFALIWQLFVPPVVSMANNGDFGKLLGRFGLGSDEVFQHANTRYVFGICLPRQMSVSW